MLSSIGIKAFLLSHGMSQWPLHSCYPSRMRTLHERMRTQVFFFFTRMSQWWKRIVEQKHGWNHGARRGHEKIKKCVKDWPSQNLLKEQSSKKEKPWLTQTESCEPDESDVEEMKPFEALPAGPLAEETWIREPIHGCRTGVTSNKESHLHPRHTQWLTVAEPFQRTVLKERKKNHGLHKPSPANQMSRMLKKWSPSRPFLPDPLPRKRGFESRSTGARLVWLRIRGATCTRVIHNEGQKTSRSDHQWVSKCRAERPEATLNPELERGINERQNGKQRSGILPRDLKQKAESHFQEIGRIAEQQFHIHQGAHRLILFHKNTFKPDAVKQDSFCLKYLMVS